MDVVVGQVYKHAKLTATVQFVGPTEFGEEGKSSHSESTQLTINWRSGETWVGIEVDSPDGKNDGSVREVQYFTCKKKVRCIIHHDIV